MESIRLAKFGYGFTSLWHGDYEIAKQYISEALKDAERIGDPKSQMLGHTYLAIVHRFQGNQTSCLKAAEAALKFAEQGGHNSYAASAKANIAWTIWREGDHQASEKLSKQAISLWGTTYPFKWLGLWNVIDITLHQTCFGQALEYASGLIEPTQKALPQEVESQLEQGIRDFQSHKEKQGILCLQRALDWAKETGHL